MAMWLCTVLVLLLLMGGPPPPPFTAASAAQLSPSFYDKACPDMHDTVRGVLKTASESDPRLPASLIRLHFHDCFVQGCDGSILLNDTATFVGEQRAAPNNNSIRGLGAVNQIKAALEKVCPTTVSCADILALSAQISSVLAHGPNWTVPLGRRDSLTASKTLAGQNLPAPSFSLNQLISAFAAQGLNISDLVALSGAHTIGRARCSLFVSRLYNFNNTGKPDPTLDVKYLQALRLICPNGGPASTLADLDPTTPDSLDNNYFSNVKVHRGLLRSDQVLFSSKETMRIVNQLSSSQEAFSQSFGAAMIKMGNIGVLTGSQGEIRKHCNFVNN